ncbi:MAG: triose-phosphate isomerase [Thermoanaerobaculia bacterium]|nr:triose-phosphate isomerase [Thermoanaerobaculia bacterium]
MPNRHLIANWKMNLPPEGVGPYMEAIHRAASARVSIAVAPPFPYLKETAGKGGDLIIAGQNCADHESGAFTGEVSPGMLRACGARAVIVGHSERRSLYGESDAVVARKLSAAVAAGLTPVLCIGEDLRTRDAGHVSRFLADQIKAAATSGLEAAKEIVLAYEPVWAIGTGRNASGAMLAETVGQIRESLERFWPVNHAKSTAILYGGSVTPENTADLVAHGAIDGFLVGGASLDSGKLLAILAAMGRD